MMIEKTRRIYHIARQMKDLAEQIEIEKKQRFLKPPMDFMKTTENIDAKMIELERLDLELARLYLPRTNLANTQASALAKLMN